jgi:mRNA interferase MazF
MATRGNVPEVGDVVWLEFDPHAGHEQSGHRPALVLSPARYNGKDRADDLLPHDYSDKGFPFEVGVDFYWVTSVVLADQIKSLDWKARHARKKGTVPSEVLAHVRAMLKALLVMT